MKKPWGGRASSAAASALAVSAAPSPSWSIGAALLTEEVGIGSSSFSSSASAHASLSVDVEESGALVPTSGLSAVGGEADPNNLASKSMSESPAGGGDGRGWGAGGPPAAVTGAAAAARSASLHAALTALRPYRGGPAGVAGTPVVAALPTAGESPRPRLPGYTPPRLRCARPRVGPPLGPPPSRGGGSNKCSILG